MCIIIILELNSFTNDMFCFALIFLMFNRKRVRLKSPDSNATGCLDLQSTPTTRAIQQVVNCVSECRDHEGLEHDGSCWLEL